jgi:putative FmdB family regulatory protein
MPLYEFECRNCHERFEELVRSSADAEAPVVCPVCGKQDAVRVISAPARAGGGGEGGGHGSGGGCAGHGGFS